ncbi:MAG: DUF6252 family protein [Mucilaginibacter sp.]
MKKLLAIVCCAVCMIIYSCHKDSKVIPQDFYFKSSKNGVAWGAQGSAAKILGDSLRITAFRPTGEEQLYVDIKFNGAGTYPLTPGQAKFFTTIGMDVLTSEYRLDTTQHSKLVISGYDAKNNIISGSGDFYMLKNSPDYVPLTFGGSTFRVKLPD